MVKKMGFRMIYDAITKTKLLEQIYEDVGKMNRECKEIFKKAYECLVKNRDEEALELAREDTKINKYEVKIRNDIMGYLAINTAPDLNTALTLASVVIDYERIGDYSKIIAQLGLLYPAKLEDGEYIDIITQTMNTVLKQFDLAHEAFVEGNDRKAQLVIDSYAGIKTLHDALVHKINKEKDIEINKAIVYAALAIYLRRIGAHLKNIATSVIAPFPEIGFEKKDF
ncbi:MAG: PhoU domain-containing protein [Candidatus Thermoplasmatota archaeon]|nr:PhoU domain-containing protein [Candidatus Thermoplasmatota archaeon]